MQSLKEYINESLLTEMGMMVKNRNLAARDAAADETILKKYNLVYNDRTGCYDCNGDIEVNKDLVAPGGHFKVKFGVIKGNFCCFDLGLISLEGAPKEVGGCFNCSGNKLTSLEGAPKEVGRYFSCHDNDLTSLEGAPEKVGGNFFCSYNKLTSLKGAPKEVDNNFNCSNNRLTSLEGAPKKVGGLFDCSNNKLKTLEGAPKEVRGDFYCNDNPLVYDEKNFYGCLPDVIGGELKAGDDCDYELAKDYYDKK